jgi:hypothetical protein
LSCHEFGYAGILSSSPQPGERETDSRFQDEETLGTALLREAGNNDRHGREHAQGGYDLALSLDEFRTGEDVRTALNVLREHLSRGGTFVVSCRIAAATGLHLPSGELAFRLETMAKLLRDYFGVVTYAFLHGDEFKAEWNQYSDRAVFFCRFLKSTRPAETSLPVEELDKTYGGGIKGLVPFSPAYLLFRDCGAEITLGRQTYIFSGRFSAPSAWAGLARGLREDARCSRAGERSRHRLLDGIH